MICVMWDGPVTLVPNIFHDIIGKGRVMIDPIHPDSEAYTIMAHYFYKALKPYL